MAPHLQDLPDELLVEVLGYLPKSDLKSARLTCTRYGRIGAQWLIQRVYFAPRKSVIETFLKISANPTFARTVTDLVYDGRLFLPELVAYKPYKEAFDENILVFDNNVWGIHGVGNGDNAGDEEVGNATGPTNNAVSESAPMSWSAKPGSIGGEVYHETLAINLVRYTGLYEQQQSILEDQKDYEALLTGLTSLPYITNVAIIDSFSYDFKRRSLEADDHSSYSLRSFHEPGVVQPAHWPRNMHPGDPVGNKWDVRGVQNLIRAVSMRCRKLSRLDLGPASSTAPMTFFEMDQDIFEAASKIAQRLTSLNLNLYMSISDSWDDVQFQYEGLEGFLSDAKELRCLTVRGRIDFDYIKHIVWPHLKTLTLESLPLDAADLKAMMQTHKGTLRDLDFCNVYLYGGEGWANAAKEMSKYLRLHRICVLGVCDDLTREALGQPYLDDEANVAVARSFMQSISSTKVMQVDLSTFTACLEEDSSPVEAGDGHSSSTNDQEGEDEDEDEEEEENEEEENEEQA